MDVIGQKSEEFPPCYLQSPLPMNFTPPRAKVVLNWLVMCNVNIVYRNLKYEIMARNLNEIVCS